MRVVLLIRIFKRPDGDAGSGNHHVTGSELPGYYLSVATGLEGTGSATRLATIRNIECGIGTVGKTGRNATDGE